MKDRFQSINSSLNNEVTKRMKTDAWKAIALSVNAASGGTLRTSLDVKSKWRAIKREVLKLRDASKTTGGGGPMTKPWYYDVALDIIGERSDIYAGATVPGGGQSGLFKTLRTEPDISDDRSIKLCADAVDPQHGLHVSFTEDNTSTQSAMRDLTKVDEVSQPSATTSGNHIDPSKKCFPAASVTLEDLECVSTGAVCSHSSVTLTATPKKIQQKILNTRTQKRLRDVTVEKKNYDNLLACEIKKVEMEMELIGKKMKREEELGELQKQHAVMLHEAQIELIKRQTDMYALKSEMIKNNMKHQQSVLPALDDI